MSSHCLLSSTAIILILPWYMMSFPITALKLFSFKVFSFSSSFKNSIMLYLGVTLFIFILLGVCWAFCIYRLLFIKFKKFSVIVFINIFSSISPCLWYLGLSFYVYGMFDVPQVSETSFIFLQFFLFVLQIG